MLCDESKHFCKECFKLRPSISLSVGPLVRNDRVGKCETRISAPAHPSATGIGRVSGLVGNDYCDDNMKSKPNNIISLKPILIDAKNYISSSKKERKIK